MSDFDQQKQSALLKARTQKPPKAEDFSHLQNGRANNYHNWEKDNSVSQNQPQNLHMYQNPYAGQNSLAGQNLQRSQRPQNSQNAQAFQQPQTRAIGGGLPTNNTLNQKTGNESDGMNNGERLEKARENSNNPGAKQMANAAKDLSAAATPMGAVSLMKQIDPLKDIPYFLAIGAAMLKDLITLVTFETVLLPLIAGGLCTIFIFMMMYLVDSGGKRKLASSLLKKGGVLLFGGIVGGVIPFVETITVFVVYAMTLSERKNASKSQQNAAQDGDENDNENGGDNDEFAEEFADAA